MITVMRAGTGFPSVYNSLGQPHATHQPVRQLQATKVRIHKYGQRPSTDFQKTVPSKVVVMPVRQRFYPGDSMTDDQIDRGLTNALDDGDMGLGPVGTRTKLPRKVLKELFPLIVRRMLQRQNVNVQNVQAVQQAVEDPGFMQQVAAVVAQDAAAAGRGAAAVARGAGRIGGNLLMAGLRAGANWLAAFGEGQVEAPQVPHLGPAIDHGEPEVVEEQIHEAEAVVEHGPPEGAGIGGDDDDEPPAYAPPSPPQLPQQNQIHLNPYAGQVKAVKLPDIVHTNPYYDFEDPAKPVFNTPKIKSANHWVSGAPIKQEPAEDVLGPPPESKKAEKTPKYTLKKPKKRYLIYSYNPEVKHLVLWDTERNRKVPYQSKYRVKTDFSLLDNKSLARLSTETSKIYDYPKDNSGSLARLRRDLNTFLGE